MVNRTKREGNGKGWLAMKPQRLHLVTASRWNVGGGSRHANKALWGAVEASSCAKGFWVEETHGSWQHVTISSAALKGKCPREDTSLLSPDESLSIGVLQKWRIATVREKVETTAVPEQALQFLSSFLPLRMKLACFCLTLGALRNLFGILVGVGFWTYLE